MNALIVATNKQISSALASAAKRAGAEISPLLSTPFRLKEWQAKGLSGLP